MRKNLSAATKRKLLLFSCILWFVNTGIWAAMVVIDLYDGVAPTELTMLRVLTAVLSLVAAIANLVRYRMMQDDTENQ